MNKISGILPTSARIESVDMKQERPLRAGTVSFGQPVAKSAVRPSPIQKDTVGGLSSDAFEVSLKKPGLKSEELIDDTSKSFFLKKRSEEAFEADANAVQADGADGQEPRLSVRV